MTARVLAAALIAAVIFLGIHVVLLAATAVIAGAIIFTLYGIAGTVADCGWRTVPCRRRFAW